MICVIGTGYVGLVTGACFANLGQQVTCVDKDPQKITPLLAGTCPIFEPELQEIIRKNIQANRLFFTQDLTRSVQNSEVIFIAVGTPQTTSGSSDTSYILEAVTQIAKSILALPAQDRGFRVIVNKSTVPIGMGEIVTSLLKSKGLTDQDFSVVSNPEFLREGTAVYDFQHPERVILGGTDPGAIQLVAELYAPLGSTVPIVKTSLETAEMIKYASNAFLATKISFMNELAQFCDGLQVDILTVAKAMGQDKRIGPLFLQPGPGFGGSCFPKDVRALIHSATNLGQDLKILQAVDAVNTGQIHWVFDKIQTLLGELNGKKVGILGLAFKAGTDDIRESPAFPLIEGLLAQGVQVRVFDPEAMPNSRQLLQDRVYWAGHEYEVVEQADLLVVVTDWNEFKQLDFLRIKSLMRHPIVFDTRNIYDPSKLKSLGFIYAGVGRN